MASTAKFDTWQNSAGKPLYGARAWVNFNGTGTVAIRASGNVSSITDNGIGTYTVNFTAAMTDANYAASMTASSPQSFLLSAGDGGANPTASAIVCYTTNSAGGAGDASYVFVTVH